MAGIQEALEAPSYCDECGLIHGPGRCPSKMVADNTLLLARIAVMEEALSVCEDGIISVMGDLKDLAPPDIIKILEDWYKIVKSALSSDQRAKAMLEVVEAADRWVNGPFAEGESIHDETELVNALSRYHSTMTPKDGE